MAKKIIILLSIFLISLSTSISAKTLSSFNYQSPIIESANLFNKDFFEEADPFPVNKLRNTEIDITPPQKILSLMVEFSGFTFEDNISNQDYLANPDYTIKDYISRYMFHLHSYYSDVSRQKYNFDYEVFPQIITLNKPISYYGDSANSLFRRVELIEDVVAIAKSSLDFSEYDAYIIFHSGPGRETDISGENPDCISSSFVNLRTLQYVLDPDNEDYPGIHISGNTYLKEISIIASHQQHPDTESNYGVMGILTYLFGRQIGLPTLFGNLSSLGRASGTGNFCLMGTGAWNANGHVPPFLSGWVRYLMNWEDAIEIDMSNDNLNLGNTVTTLFQANHPRLYKIPISAEEYFLIENREQNPDNSTLNGMPSFTFQLLPDGEQEYYPPPYSNIPRFNFMENTYRGCEWDYYLPGLGDPDFPQIDGSGILIWHINEKVIANNFEHNTINADPKNQGVTLIEADGIQHLSSSTPDINMRGSAYDAFRDGHNNYFGKKYKGVNEILSIPFVKSYYGDVDLEIFDISSSGALMSFSVNLPVVLKIDYQGNDIYPLAMPNGLHDKVWALSKTGKVLLYENSVLAANYPVTTDSIPRLYAYSKELNALIIPTENQNSASLLSSSTQGMIIIESYNDFKWASHPIIISQANQTNSMPHIAVALNSSSNAKSKLIVYNQNLTAVKTIEMDEPIISNLVYSDNTIHLLTKDNIISSIQLEDDTTTLTELALPDSTAVSHFAIASIREQESNPVLITSDNRLFVFDSNGIVLNNFPVKLSGNLTSPPSFADISNNGSYEIIVGSANIVNIIGSDGDRFLYPATARLPSSTSVNSGSFGAFACDVNGNGNMEIIAVMSENRLAIWDNKLRLLPGYPRVFSADLLNYPILSETGSELFVTGVNGSIYSHTVNAAPDANNLEYGNLQRTAYYPTPQTNNTFLTEKVFVSNENYVFPSPLTYQNGGVLYFNLMISKNAAVDIKIFDISGKQIFRVNKEMQAYQRNRDKLGLNISGLSTGVYVAVIQALNEQIELKFAVEK